MILTINFPCPPPAGVSLPELCLARSGIKSQRVKGQPHVGLLNMWIIQSCNKPKPEPRWCRDCPTCALAAGVFPLGGAEKPAVEVFLPKLGKPHVPPIVLQREPSEVFIKAWGIEGERKWESSSVPHQLSTWRKWGRTGASGGRRRHRHQCRLFGWKHTGKHN